MLLKLEGFCKDRSLELNMGYYHTQHKENASNLCTSILPMGKYCYKHLPICVANSPDIFQQKFYDSFHGFKLICAYIGEFFILPKRDCTDHVQNL